MHYSGKSFLEIEIDEVFESQLTVTESHIVTGAGLFGDFNPLHVDDLYCKNTRFGKEQYTKPARKFYLGKFSGSSSIINAIMVSDK